MTRMMMMRVVVDMRLPSGGTVEHVSCPQPTGCSGAPLPQRTLIETAFE